MWKLLGQRSLSSRRAWIEIKSALTKIYWFCCRSPHGERGLKFVGYWNICIIACRSPHGERGLKFCVSRCYPHDTMSLSSRRAWIEIYFKSFCVPILLGRSPHGERGLKCQPKLRGFYWGHVALLTESVDWNQHKKSVSCSFTPVALLTESVDWNKPFALIVCCFICRSPHGERGLKFLQWNY